jgi:hypothetical protein
VDEYVLRTAFRRDETKTLLITEPLHCTSSHLCYLPFVRLMGLGRIIIKMAANRVKSAAYPIILMLPLSILIYSRASIPYTPILSREAPLDGLYGKIPP